jgi:CDP-4-dehydro-6-deoxyglucose reductase, E3
VTADHRSRGGCARDVGSYTITLSPIGDTVVCRREETVLSAILRSGAKVVFGCRGGGCGTCKMRLVSGRVEHGRCSAAVLLEEERENGSFLSCQARALSDLTVELTATNKYRGPMAAWRWLGCSDS